MYIELELILSSLDFWNKAIANLVTLAEIAALKLMRASVSVLLMLSVRK